MSSNLSIQDNQLDFDFLNVKGNPDKKDFNNLSLIANASVESLSKQNSSLLIFPQVLGFHDDGIEENEILKLHGNADDLSKVKISTGNLMGFVGINDTQLKITSRFSQEDENDFFMHYMLQKVFSINLFDLKYTSGNNGELDLLMFSFPLLLKKALAQGLFKTYKTFKRNDSNVKGVIDINRHIRFNYPFNGNVAYNSRERTFDNSITQLIRHTIEYIKSKPYGKDILNCDLETKECVSEILESTPLYNVHEREKIISENLKSVNHPYFTAYKPLQKLCVAILRHKKIGYGTSSNKVYGVLFDGAWLWEEYLWTVLKKSDFKHPKNKTKTNGIHIHKGYICYPDFYKGKQFESRPSEEEMKNNFILDAKYKRGSYFNNFSEQTRSSVQRADLHQLITYLHILPANAGGLIYPYDGDEDDLIVESKDIRELYGFGGALKTYGVKIPKKSNSYVSFSDEMKEIEKKIENYQWTKSL